MNPNDFYIPKYLDEPFRVLIWTPDEAGVIFGAFTTGVLTDNFLLGIIGSIVGFIFLKKAKSKTDGNFAFRLMYWYLPHFKGLYRWLTPSYIREYLG